MGVAVTLGLWLTARASDAVAVPVEEPVLLTVWLAVPMTTGTAVLPNWVTHCSWSDTLGEDIAHETLAVPPANAEQEGGGGVGGR